jgi:hypothetical protein
MQEAFNRIQSLDPNARPFTVIINDPYYQTYTGLQRQLASTFTVPSGASWVLPNPVPIVLKLYDANGNQLPPSTNVYLARKSNGYNFPEFLGEIKYSPYYDLTEAQQRDSQYYPNILATLSPLRSGNPPLGFLFKEGDILEIYVETNDTAALSLSNPNTRIEFPVGVDTSRL